MAHGDYAIEVSGLSYFHLSFVARLVVDGPPDAFPVVVGCSLRTPEGMIVDVPAQRLSSPGRALWAVRPGDWGDDAWMNRYGEEQSGHAIFAIYADAAFSERLADTGWLPFDAPCLIGSSHAALDEANDGLREWIGVRANVWMPLEDQ